MESSADVWTNLINQKLRQVCLLQLFLLCTRNNVKLGLK